MKELLAWLAIGLVSFCATKPALAVPGLGRASASSRSSNDGQWNVRVEVLMVAMPQEKVLALLPALRDPKKIDDAVEQMLAAILRKEAVLTGYPVVHTLSGKRSVSETILEKRYPTEFEPPQSLQIKGAPVPAVATDPNAITDSPIPTAFETRNTGVTLEVEPHVSDRGEFIRLDVVPQRVELIRFDSYDSAKTASGKVVKVDQPQFFTTKANTIITVRNGQRTLIAVHLLSKPENYIEVQILQAFANPIK